MADTIVRVDIVFPGVALKPQDAADFTNQILCNKVLPAPEWSVREVLVRHRCDREEGF